MRGRNYSVSRTMQRVHRLWASGRQTGDYPETGFEEVGQIGTAKSACRKLCLRLWDRSTANRKQGKVTERDHCEGVSGKVTMIRPNPLREQARFSLIEVG